MVVILRRHLSLRFSDDNRGVFKVVIINWFREEKTSSLVYLSLFLRWVFYSLLQLQAIKRGTLIMAVLMMHGAFCESLEKS